MAGDDCCLDARGAMKAESLVRIVFKNGAESALFVGKFRNTRIFLTKFGAASGNRR